MAAALAHYAQARAFVSQQSAAELPRVSATASPTRNRQSDTRPLRGAGSPNEYNAVSLGGEIDYELDLWGRVRNTVAAAKDEAQATKADLASVQLSLEAQLAQSYLQLRGLDRQTKLLHVGQRQGQHLARAGRLRDRRRRGPGARPRHRAV
ncbi:TolC family protein, partial [Burkholderia gladioli]|nr:TolC family protein [Burkholderia gladioli]